MQKPSIPKGTRDFSPEEMAKRNYIFNTIRDVFHLYGFQQIETPAMENLSTLMGKYGEEGDKLLFKILDSGDYLSDYNEEERELIGEIVDAKKLLISRSVTNKNKKDVIRKLIELSGTNNGQVLIDVVLKQLLVDGILVRTEDGYLSSAEDINLDEIKNVVKNEINKVADELLKNTIRPIVGKDKGLRYDLTVPFARFVVQHRNEINFPFKRYQIQPVWRADRPQKGRYREFYQCDVDIIGSDSLINEVELIQITDEIFSRLGVNVAIKLNNRKILTGIAEIIGQADKIVDITVAIDKLDKIGLDKVNEELRGKGLTEEAIERLQPIIMLDGSNKEKIEILKKTLAASETGLKGVEEVEFILNRLQYVELRSQLELDLTLARGLNYYTGAIFEVKALDVQIGSITGGGRYDNLTGVFGMEGVSGVGISFGADRIFDVLNQLELYPEDSLLTTQLLFVNFGEVEEQYLLPVVAQVRAAHIRTELYPEAAKMKKQMSYADAKGIPFVAIVGANEMAENKINLKNMLTGEQTMLTVSELIASLS
ncbi:histidine--tRNA ligase [Parabacteroides sp. PF5-9]|uniref:histidine--tRNA ligase n=1 Tax=Parabacteroides sp. PF5-9 TaxID=1742404 RepID=UPI0024737C21|nr:histidine--tRNA ligase [Parabacteroides sp. PF5-9]MDH6357259.1 histidyl-tRNA synthetase [Parabacteroides sp. PF5-9]